MAQTQNRLNMLESPNTTGGHHSRNATGKIMKHVLTGEGENTFVEE